MSNVKFVVVDCLQVPKVLFQDERFKGLSVTAKVLYSMLLDRLNMAAYNNWIDEKEQPYVVYSKRAMQKDLNCTKYTINQALNELMSADHLIRVVCENGIGNRFYLKDVGKADNGDSVMTLAEIMDNMTPEDREKIMDRIVCVSKDIVVDMEKMGYIETEESPEPDQDDDPMAERGYYMEDGSLDVESIEADADDLGTELAINCISVYQEDVAQLEEVQSFLNDKFMFETDLELMSAVDTLVMVFGGSIEYINDMYACQGEARKIYLEEFMNSYNSITDTIVENR